MSRFNAVASCRDLFHSRLARAITVALLALVLMLLTILALDFWASKDAAKTSYWVDHTTQVISTLGRIRSQVADLETGKRGYLLTADQSYLHPYGASEENVAALLGRLRLLVSDNPAELELANELAAAISAKLQEMDEIIDIGRTEGIDAAAAKLRGGEGRQLMDAVRGRIDRMLSNEWNSLTAQQENAARSRDQLSQYALSTVVIGLIGSALAALMIGSEFNRRRRATERLNAMTDIAERQVVELRESQEDAMRAKERAERSDQAKVRFLAAAGHDLRQPLQILAMAVERLSRMAGANGGKDADRAFCAIDGLGRAFDQFSEAARLSSGFLAPKRCRIAVGAVIAQVCQDLEPLAASKRLHLRHVATGVCLETDPDMLATILRNLIGNAIKYTNTGGVVVGLRRRGSVLSLEVRDSGIGIAPDKLVEIFQEFHQLDHESSEGIGLGLSIVQRTADLLGYPIVVESTPGRGSNFRVGLNGGWQWFERPSLDGHDAETTMRP